MIHSDIISSMMLVILIIYFLSLFLVNTKRNIFDHKLKRDENSGRKKKDEYELAEE